MSELVCGKNPLAHLTRWMDKGRGGVPLKRECSRKEKTSAQRNFS